ncbi:MAG: TetR family transcriptional regulator [Myxococcota bacterium]|jgi:AcrR family transcriptional regulator|nr:TetR family transcriptional regulator [Myxococcota bacterium]
MTIAAAAIETVRNEGSRALSMRKVAGEFGVDVAARYRHFRNKDELLDEVGRLASEISALGVPFDGSWEGRFRELCESNREQIVSHPLDDFIDMTNIVTAMPVVSAIPTVCTAEPGIRTYADLPLITGHYVQAYQQSRKKPEA